jgi:hypothetical protein
VAVRLTRARRRYRLTPWWVKVVVIWLLSRVVSTSLLLVFAGWQEKTIRTSAHPGLLAFSQLWDSVWYHYIAVAGYPSTLPVSSDGHVAENSWAFLPAYPVLVRGISTVTAIPWESASVMVSLLFSLAASLMIYRLLQLVLPDETALFSVVLFCVAPLSPLLQVAYAESMFLFLLALALYLLIRRRYALLFPVVAVMALTRPSGLAFACALGLHLVHRWWIRRRQPFPAAEAIPAIALAAFSLLMGFAWSIAAWVVTGSASAYTDTELVWRALYIGRGALVPFTPWIQGAQFWGGQWNLGAVAIPILVLFVVAFFAVLFAPAVKRLGPDLRIWCVSYALYLLAVFFPQSSTFRLLMPLFPFLGAVARPKSVVYRITIVALSIVGQFAWLYLCWWVNGVDWSPP